MKQIVTIMVSRNFKAHKNNSNTSSNDIHLESKAKLFRSHLDGQKKEVELRRFLPRWAIWPFKRSQLGENWGCVYTWRTNSSQSWCYNSPEELLSPTNANSRTLSLPELLIITCITAPSALFDPKLRRFKVSMSFYINLLRGSPKRRRWEFHRCFNRGHPQVSMFTLSGKQAGEKLLLLKPLGETRSYTRNTSQRCELVRLEADIPVKQVSLLPIPHPLVVSFLARGCSVINCFIL